MTHDEIRAAIAARPELADLVAAGDHVGIAAALSVGRTRLRATQIGPGTIMAALGAADGATLLETLTALAAQSATVPAYVPIKWALKIIDRGEFDMSAQAARDQVVALAAAGVMSNAARDALLALGQEPDPVSEFDVRCAIYNADGSLAV